MRRLRSPRSLLDSAAHSWTHPEGWRDWPYEAPATTARHGGKVPIPDRCVAGLRALCHTVTRRRTTKGAQWL
jgi:hypothetical protein